MVNDTYKYILPLILDLRPYILGSVILCYIFLLIINRKNNNKVRKLIINGLFSYIIYVTMYTLMPLIMPSLIVKLFGYNLFKPNFDIYQRVRLINFKELYLNASKHFKYLIINTGTKNLVLDQIAHVLKTRFNKQDPSLLKQILIKIYYTIVGRPGRTYFSYRFHTNSIPFKYQTFKSLPRGYHIGNYILKPHLNISIDALILENIVNFPKGKLVSANGVTYTMYEHSHNDTKYWAYYNRSENTGKMYKLYKNIIEYANFNIDFARNYLPKVKKCTE